MHLWATKLKVDIFTHTPRQNPPRFLLSHPCRWKLLIPQGSGFLKFFSPPSRKGGKKLWINIKNNKNNLLMILRLFQPNNFLCKHFPKIHDNNFQFFRKKANVMSCSSPRWIFFFSFELSVKGIVKIQDISSRSNVSCG